MDNQREGYHREYRKEYAKRTKYVNVAIPMDDYKRLEVNAKKYKKKTSAYLRELAFAQMDHGSIIPPEIEDSLREHNLLIRNIANNLNQMAHSANIFHNIDRDVVFKHLKTLDDQIKGFVDEQLNK